MLKVKNYKDVYSIISILLFQLAVISTYVLGFEVSLFRISKVIILIFMIWTALCVMRKGKIFAGENLIPPVLFMLVTGGSCLWADDVNAALLQLITQVQMYILFFLVYLLFKDHEEYLKCYIHALYITGICMAFYALSRYGVNGFIIAMQNGERMGGLITNENTFGMAFSLSAIVAFYYYLRNRKLIHLLSIVVFAFFALSSGSKKAALMILFGIIGMAALENRFHKIWRVILISGISILLFYNVMRLPIFSTISQRLHSYLAGDYDKGDLIREQMVKVGLQLFRRRPILGYGIGNYARISGMGGYSHNNFIEVLVSTGFVGFVLYYYTYVKIIIWGLKEGVKKKNYLKTLLLLLACINIVFGYGMVQIYSKTSWIMLAVMVASADTRAVADKLLV